MSTGSEERQAGFVFRTTHWSVVLAAVDSPPPRREEALEELCQSYWKPLYAWLRRSHPELSPQDAQDCVQGFFSDLLERVALTKVDPAKGKFRSFLLASLKHHLRNEQCRLHAQKRGGRFEFVSWEDGECEGRVEDSSSGILPPDRVFERTWAMALIGRVLGRLQMEMATAGRAAHFELLQVYLTGDRGAMPYAEAAQKLGMESSALKMSVQRLRRRFGEMLREEVSQTVTRPEEIDAEIRVLFAALGE